MRFIPILATAVVLAAPSLAPAATPPAPAGARHILLVSDAFEDGSGWRVVHDILFHKGYKVSVVQLPHVSLGDDVGVVRDRIAMQLGPVVMVGHGYGGLVISEAGARPKVKALVYVAGFQPDVGEGIKQLNASMPAAGAASVRSTRDGHLFVDPDKFNADYAADIKVNRTDFMAASQALVPNALFSGNIWTAAWHDKPTYGIVASDDRVLNPDLQRWMYKRAGSKVTEIKASHAVHISQPEAVAQVIEEAARNVR
uniref:alpha/beta fold hydrolase n=1 Tax=Cupriavidus yeoncheonensis TaxID=1462994 RepID=UPI003F49803B